MGPGLPPALWGRAPDPPRRRPLRPTEPDPVGGRPGVAPGAAEGLAGAPRRRGVRPRGRRRVGALRQGPRALRIQHHLQDVRLVVGRAGGDRRDRLLRVLHLDAVRPAHGRAPAAAGVAAVQALLRIAGDHELAPHRQRRRLGLRLPLVPSLRRRQHPRRLGHGRHAGGGLGEPVAGRHRGARRRGRGGRLARPGAGPDRDLLDHARPRLPLRLRAPAARGGDRSSCGSRSRSRTGRAATRRPRSRGSWSG